MAQQTINIGATANDGTGDQLRTAFDKVNDNFNEIYTELGGTSLSNISFSGNTISTDNTNGDLTIDPNGSGTIVLANATSCSSTLTVTGATVCNGSLAAAGTGGSANAFGASDTTPSVSAGNVFTTDGTAQTLTDFDNGVAGQIIYVISTDATVFDVTGTNLNGGSTDITTASGDVTTWLCENGTDWHLISYKDQSANHSTGL